MRFLIFFISVFALTLADNIPVLVWGPASPYTSATALKSYTPEEFGQILKSYMKDDTLGIVISENSLSNEDLSLCKTSEGITCYANIQKIPNKLYLANVQDPVDFLKTLDNDQPEIIINSNGDVMPTIVPEKGKFLFITFNDAGADNTHESRAALLQSHDAIISKLTQELSALHDNVLIIYTGKNSKINSRKMREVEAGEKHNETVPVPAAAVVSPSESPIITTTKAAAATKEEVKEPLAIKKIYAPLTAKDGDYTFFNLEKLLIHFRNITYMNGDVEQLFDAQTPVITTKEDYWIVDMTDGTNNFAFNITNLSGRWYIDGAKWNKNEIYTKVTMAANDGFGFHCSPTIDFKQGKNIVLRWRELQIQPEFTDVKLTIFGDTWDCVGFTSPGIWAGLFITFIMIFILTIGMCWMLDIRTMDRFDDPKGKTITINVNE